MSFVRLASSVIPGGTLGGLIAVLALLALQPGEYVPFSRVHLIFAFGISLQYSVINEAWARGQQSGGIERLVASVLRCADFAVRRCLHCGFYCGVVRAHPAVHQLAPLAGCHFRPVSECCLLSRPCSRRGETSCDPGSTRIIAFAVGVAAL